MMSCSCQPEFSLRLSIECSSLIASLVSWEGDRDVKGPLIGLRLVFSGRYCCWLKWLQGGVRVQTGQRPIWAQTPAIFLPACCCFSFLSYLTVAWIFLSNSSNFSWDGDRTVCRESTVSTLSICEPTMLLSSKLGSKLGSKLAAISDSLC